MDHKVIYLIKIIELVSLFSWMKNTPREKKTFSNEESDEEMMPRKKIPELMSMINNGLAPDVRVLPPPDIFVDLPRYPKKLKIQEQSDKKNINLNYVSVFSFQSIF